MDGMNDQQQEQVVDIAAAAAAVAVAANNSLPSGWVALEDPSSGQIYFYDSTTGETSWERPTTAEEEAAAAAAVTAARVRRKLKLNSILDRQDKFPLRQRDKIDELTEEYIEKLGKDIHAMICDQNQHDAAIYQGLDCDRDTEAEVETALREYPELLGQRKSIVWEWNEDETDGEMVDAPEGVEGEGDYPIQCLYSDAVADSCFLLTVYILKTIPYIHLFARLAMEFGSYEIQERGGLMIAGLDGMDTVCILDCLFTRLCWKDGENCHQLFDRVMLTQMIHFRRMGLLKKEEIQRYLMLLLCGNTTIPNQYYFSENRFQFLIEWDPNLLTKTMTLFNHDRGPFRYIDGNLALHSVVRLHNFIRAFQVVFECGIRYFPNKIGISLLFRKNDEGETPIQMICNKYSCDEYQRRREELMNIVENSYTCYADVTPVNAVDVLVSAAIDERVHLDCVYFLFRRNPAVLMKLVLGLNDNDNGNDNGGDGDGDGDDGNGNGNGNDGNGTRRDDEEERTETVPVADNSIVNYVVHENINNDGNYENDSSCDTVPVVVMDAANH